MTWGGACGIAHVELVLFTRMWVLGIKLRMSDLPCKHLHCLNHCVMCMFNAGGRAGALEGQGSDVLRVGQLDTWQCLSVLPHVWGSVLSFLPDIIHSVAGASALLLAG